MAFLNLTTNETNHYPLWYYFNDSLMIIGNLIGIYIALLFIYTIYRLDHPYYSVSNLIACNTCLAVALTSTVMLFNACYALKSDFRGQGYSDPFCVLRGTLLKLFHINMYTSLCLKAFNRLRCIVYYTNPILTSYRCLIVVLLCQWFLSIFLVLIIFLTDGIGYEWGSHLCLIPLTKIYHFVFLMVIYYSSILFIIGVYVYILYYVYHLPLLERYRRKRQFALLRRILVLVIMLLIPGVFSTFLLIHWSLYGWIPVYSFKIRNLLDTIGYTGSVITIFVSHTIIRRQCYQRKKKIKVQYHKTVHLKNGELILFKDQSQLKPRVHL